MFCAFLCPLSGEKRNQPVHDFWLFFFPFGQEFLTARAPSTNCVFSPFWPPAKTFASQPCYCWLGAAILWSVPMWTFILHVLLFITMSLLQPCHLLQFLNNKHGQLDVLKFVACSHLDDERRKCKLNHWPQSRANDIINDDPLFKLKWRCTIKWREFWSTMMMLLALWRLYLWRNQHGIIATDQALHWQKISIWSLGISSIILTKNFYPC